MSSETQAPRLPGGTPGEGDSSPIQERYEIGERLSEGSFFTTYRGRELSTGKAVAIKVLKPAHAADEVFAARLLEDAVRASRLRHPNIAETLEARRDHNTVVIVTEWVRGINLKDRILRVAPFPLTVALDIFLACVDALLYAHRQQTPNGDVRPENVVITPDGRVKLVDFGLTQGLLQSTRHQALALPLAAPYLAPEITRGQPPSVSADIYSLGCVLHEMLAGEPPFTADNPLAMAVRHLNEPVPSLRRFNSSVPPAVEGLVRKCLQKNPADRYAGLEDLLQDVHAIRDALKNDRPLNWSPLAEPVRPNPPPTSVSTPPSVLSALDTTPGEPVAAAGKRAASGRSSAARRRPEREVDLGPSIRLLVGMFVVILVMVGGFFAAAHLIAQAPATVVVPNTLVGMTESMARDELNRWNLLAHVRKAFSDKQPPGEVISTDPPGGREIRAGKTVVLVISQGGEPVTVPDVIGKALTAAQNQIRSAGLSLGPTKEEFSEVIPKGQVMSQLPTGEQQAARKSPVELILSKGPEPLTNPPDPDAPGELTRPVPPVPDDSGGVDEPQQHQVSIEIPRRLKGPQQIRIVVVREDGSEDVIVDEQRNPGDVVEQTVTTQGPRGREKIRVYLNDKLIPQSSYGG